MRTPAIYRSPRQIKRTLLIGFCVLALTMAMVGSAFGTTLNFSSVNVPAPGTSALLEFVGTGNTFSFVSPSSHDFQIGTGSAAGLYGDFTGTYQIVSPSTGFFQTATVSPFGTGPHQVIIYDGTGNNFTADLAWVDIYTVGTSGALNSLAATVNLTNRQYGGANQDLISLQMGSNPVVTLAWSFPAPVSLQDLTTDGSVHTISYAGSFNVGGFIPVPAPATLLLVGTGLVGLIGLRYRRGRKD